MFKKISKLFTLKNISNVVIIAVTSGLIKSLISYYFQPNLNELWGTLTLYLPISLGAGIASLVSNNILFMDDGVKAESPGSATMENAPSPNNTAPAQTGNSSQTAPAQAGNSSQTAPSQSGNNPPLGQRENTPSDRNSIQTEWSDGEEMPAYRLRSYTATTVSEVGSTLAKHKVEDPTLIAPNYNPHADSTLQPFANNLADYLYNYKRGSESNIVSDYGDFPKLDPNSLRFLIKYMNHNFPDHYGAYRLTPLSNAVIASLRLER